MRSSKSTYRTLMRQWKLTKKEGKKEKKQNIHKDEQIKNRRNTKKWTTVPWLMINYICRNLHMHTKYTDSHSFLLVYSNVNMIYLLFFVAHTWRCVSLVKMKYWPHWAISFSQSKIFNPETLTSKNEIVVTIILYFNQG